MDIMFGSTALQKSCCDDKARVKAWGPVSAKRLKRHLDNLRAAACLEDMRRLPGRCHELTGDREGHLAMDLEHPMRLIFEPADEPVPRRKDGGLDWSQVRIIRVLSVEDYHG